MISGETHSYSVCFGSILKILAKMFQIVIFCLESGGLEAGGLEAWGLEARGLEAGGLESRATDLGSGAVHACP